MNLIKTDGLRFTLLPTTTITTAVGATAGTVVSGLAGVTYLLIQAVFAWGSGGTTAKAYVQTSMDGTVWNDIMSFAFTTAILTKQSAVTSAIALAAGVTPTDGSLADNTIVNGLLGDRLRIKYVTTGTYAGGTTLTITGVAKG